MGTSSASSLVTATERDNNADQLDGISIMDIVPELQYTSVPNGMQLAVGFGTGSF
jgi:hypothetical protein